MDWKWTPGSWKDLIDSNELKDLGKIPLIEIGVPFSWNVHLHTNYDRLFWDVHRNGMKTPLLVKPWDWPPFSKRGKLGCREDGSRLDMMPAPTYPSEPGYELIIGNMRYCSLYIQGEESARCIQVLEEEWYEDVEDLWTKYHPVFEGNWYENKDYKFPSKSREIIIK